MDYRELLIKYIEHISNVEGMEFLDDTNLAYSRGRGLDISAEEEAELKKLADEMHEKYKP